MGIIEVTEVLEVIEVQKSFRSFRSYENLDKFRKLRIWPKLDFKKVKHFTNQKIVLPKTLDWNTYI